MQGDDALDIAPHPLGYLGYFTPTHTLGEHTVADIGGSSAGDERLA